MSYNYIVEQAALIDIQYVKTMMAQAIRLGDESAAAEWKARLHDLRMVATQQRMAAEEQAIREDRRAQ